MVVLFADNCGLLSSAVLIKYMYLISIILEYDQTSFYKNEQSIQT
jgi:hypothetical protein